MSIKILPVDNPYRISSTWLSRETAVVGLFAAIIGLAMLTETEDNFGAPVWVNGPLLLLPIDHWAWAQLTLGSTLLAAPWAKPKWIIFPLVGLLFVTAMFGTLLTLAGQSNVAASAFGVYVLAMAAWTAVLVFRTLDTRSEIQLARLRIARAEVEARAQNQRWRNHEGGNVDPVGTPGPTEPEGEVR